MSDSESVRVEAQLDFGPHTQVRLTEWIENVPLKDAAGNVVGRAKISDTGKIEAVIDEKEHAKDLFHLLRVGVSDALAIATHVEPAVPQPEVKYSDEIRARMKQANPFNQEGAH